MVTPLIAFPVKSIRECAVAGEILDCYRDLPYIAAELTITGKSLSRAKNFARMLLNACPEKRVYLRFHAPRHLNYDPFAKGFEGETAARSISKLVDFISGEFGGGFLVLHSTSKPDSKSIENCRNLAASSLSRGVVLCLENLADGWTSDIRAFCEVLDVSGLKAVLDIGHLNSSDCLRYSSLGRLEAVEMLLPHLAGAHVYEFESCGHHPFTDFYLVGEVLQLLFENGIYWWVVELEDPYLFVQVFKLVKSFAGQEMLFLKKSGSGGAVG